MSSSEAKKGSIAHQIDMAVVREKLRNAVIPPEDTCGKTCDCTAECERSTTMTTMPANPTPAEGVVEMRRAILDWLRDDAPVAAKMTIMPGHVDALMNKLWPVHIAAARPAAPTQSAAQTGEVERLRAALEPMALLAPDEASDAAGVNMSDPLSKWFTVAQLVAARDALSQPEPSHD